MHVQNVFVLCFSIDFRFSQVKIAKILLYLESEMFVEVRSTFQSNNPVTYFYMEYNSRQS